MIYLLLILMCYLSMIVYKELFSKKPMTIRHAVISSGVFLIIFAVIYPLFTSGSIFSPWIYPAWFFTLLGFIEIYILLMLPMFFGTVYINDRRKAWSAIIIPSAAAVFIFVWLGGSLFYEMGWLLFFVLLLYLAWGVACVFIPRFVWNGYVKLRDKIGRRISIGIVSGILIAAVVTVICIVTLTIISNTGKIEADYMPPHIAEPLTTTDIAG